MSVPTRIYRCSLALLTDLYELTMAYGYWKAGVSDREAVFNLYFRKHPFEGGFSIACGLAYVIDYLENFRFSDSDLTYLAQLRGNDERRTDQDQREYEHADLPPWFSWQSTQNSTDQASSRLRIRPRRR